MESIRPQLDLTVYSFRAGDYLAVPLNAVADQDKLLTIVSKCAAHASFFTDYLKGCEGECNGICIDKSPSCIIAKTAVVKALINDNTMCWEVWRTGEDLDLVGILRLSDIVMGCDAKAHYFFFDSKLKDKTDLLKEWEKWVATDHPGWAGIHRISVSVPAHAYALARHAKRHLGFQEEGVKREALLYNGQWWDEMILGKVLDGIDS